MKKTDPEVKEWKFSNCPDPEREACLHYEYSREYMLLHPELLAGLSDRRQAMQNAFGEDGDVFKRSPMRPYTLPLKCALFPTTPWPLVPHTERAALITNCSIRPGFDGPYTDLLVDDSFDPASLIRWSELKKEIYNKWNELSKLWSDNGFRLDGNLVSFDEVCQKLPDFCKTPKHFYAISEDENFAIIKLDSRRTENELVKAFKTLLQRQRRVKKDTEKTVVRRGGRGRTLDQLNQLGALRLLRHFGSADKVANFLSKESESPIYGDAYSVDQAARKAERNLKRMTEAGHFHSLGEIT